MVKRNNTQKKEWLWVLLFTLIFQSCRIHPVAWSPPAKPQLKASLLPNSELTSSHKIELEKWCGPEDIIFDHQGNLFCGVHRSKKDFSNGVILKVNSTNGKQEVFYDTESWVAGLHFDKDSNLIALSHKDGLIAITPNKEKIILAQEDENGQPFLIPNGLDIASDGKIYFSNTSSQSSYNSKYGRQLILELKQQGGLYEYDPILKRVKTLIAGTYFGNGVALSKNEDFILMT